MTTLQLKHTTTVIKYWCDPHEDKCEIEREYCYNRIIDAIDEHNHDLIQFLNDYEKRVVGWTIKPLRTFGGKGQHDVMILDEIKID